MRTLCRSGATNSSGAAVATVQGLAAGLRSRKSFAEPSITPLKCPPDAVAAVQGLAAGLRSRKSFAVFRTRLLLGLLLGLYRELSAVCQSTAKGSRAAVTLMSQ